MKKLLFLFLFFPLLSNGQIIESFAGNGTPGFSGDGGQASAAELNNTGGIVFDAAGNAYISDYSNSRIRKVSLSGIITTFAGNGGIGYTGDGGPALAATFNGPTNLAIDASGSLYVADLLNNVIRKISSSGIISTFAGTGTLGYSGDGGQATNARLYKASGLAIDPAGNVYIADYANNVIRKVNTSGIITTIAGTGIGGSTGDGGPATAATLYQAWGVCLDGAGNLYIADAANNNIRKVNTSGIINTICGTGLAGFSGDGGQATACELNNPPGIVIDASNNIYLADQFNNRIRKISPAGIITTIAGTGVAGYNGDGIPATSAQLNQSNSLTLDHAGNLYIVDNLNNRIRTISGCGNYITTQPVNDTVFAGNNATYTVVTTMPGPMYQWQEDPGTGFVNLSNVWPYSGVNTSALTVLNCSHFLNATHYRCVITSESSPCINTSASAILLIKSGVGVNELQYDQVHIFPNPATDLVTINLPGFTGTGKVQVYNELGQQMMEEKITGSNTNLDFSSYAAGMYILKLSTGGQPIIRKVFKD